MTPLCLVTGFLGTGKTTLLKEIVARHRGRKLVYLINEFSPEDVDGAVLLAGDSPDVVRLPGGSIFCRCLVGEFIEKLGGLRERFPDMEGVVIEASGMANPKSIQTLLHETKLDKHFAIGAIVTVVERRAFLALRQTLPNIITQIESADLIILNKTDLSTPAQLDQVEAALRQISPRAEVRRSTFGKVEFDLFGFGSKARSLSSEMDACRDPRYASTFIAMDGEVNLDGLKAELAGHQQDVLRAKGFVRCGGKGYLVDLSTTGLSVRESPIPPDTVRGIAMIIRGDASAHIRTWVEGLAFAVKAAPAARASAAVAPRLALIGGFLGAGKTSAIRALAKAAKARGLRPGAVTNDQAEGLIDTDLMRQAGIPVREVAGSCFCCDFISFSRAVRALVQEEGVDLILAEPVGSCTDLVATVIRPLSEQLGMPMEAAPVSVLIDGARWKEQRGEAGNWGMRFLLEYQLKEADLVLLGKSDRNQGEGQQELAREIQALAPQAALLSCSSVSGYGIDEWLDFILSMKPRGEVLAGLDYDRYAKAEAELGWLNAEAVLRGKGTDAPSEFLRSWMRELCSELGKSPGLGIGHLKIELRSPSGLLKAAASAQGQIDLEGSLDPADRYEAVVNLRAVLPPEELSDALLRATERLATAQKLSFSFLTLRSFKPSPPKPTFRMT